MAFLECLSIPLLYKKDLLLLVEYCWVAQKRKINTTGGSEIICSFIHSEAISTGSSVIVRSEKAQRDGNFYQEIMTIFPEAVDSINS